MYIEDFYTVSVALCAGDTNVMSPLCYFSDSDWIDVGCWMNLTNPSFF